MKFNILNRSTGNVQFSAEIECSDDIAYSIKLGLAVKAAIRSWADLRNANLSEANLSEANVSEADLSGANLSEANLREADLRIIRADIYDILLHAIPETPALLNAVQRGRINGSVYQGECACLVGTIANIRGVSYSTIDRDSERPAERWFLGIQEGDTPETSAISDITAGWIREFISLVGVGSPS